MCGQADKLRSLGSHLLGLVGVALYDGPLLMILPMMLAQAHVRLGKETIRCRVRKANQEVLKMHMM